MESSIQSDIFFTLGSIVLVIFGILLVLFIMYLIRIMRAIEEFRGAITKAKIGDLLLRPGGIGKGVIATSIVRWIVSFLRRRRRG